MQENLSMYLTIDEFRRLGYRAVDLAAEHLAQVPGGRVYRQMKAEDRTRLMELPLPDLPAAPDQLLDFIEREILAYPMGNGHPRFFGWVNSPRADREAGAPSGAFDLPLS